MERTCTDPEGVPLAAPDVDWWRKRLSIGGYSQQQSPSLLDPPTTKKETGFGGVFHSRRFSNTATAYAVSRDKAEKWVQDAKAVSLLEILNENPADYRGHVRLLRSAPKPASAPPSSQPFVDLGASPGRGNEANSSAQEPGATQLPEMLDEIVAQKEGKTVYLNFSKLLQNPVGFEEFERFLILTFSHESLAFYSAVDRMILQFKTATTITPQDNTTNTTPTTTSPNTRRKLRSKFPPLHALSDLFSDFIVDDAPRMINLSGALQKDILQHFSQIKSFDIQADNDIGGGALLNFSTSISTASAATLPDDAAVELLQTQIKLMSLLELAQQEVFHMMERDTFHRFISDERASKTWRLLCVDAARTVNHRNRQQEQQQQRHHQQQQHQQRTPTRGLKLFGSKSVSSTDISWR